MKKALLIAVTMILSLQAQAWISTAPAEKTYTFKFTLAKETLEVRKPAQSYDDAFMSAASECASYFRGHRKHLDENAKLDIVDTCANPRI